MEAIWCFRSSRFAAAAVLAAAAAASSEGALQDLKLRLKWKWEITTPHARGIIGIIGPEGVLMPPKGHRAQFEARGWHQNARGADNTNDPKGMGCSKHILTWLGQFMKKTLQARFPI